MSALPVVENNTVQTEIIDTLRRMIFSNELQPGERLVQDELAVRLKVSRTPVREAIRQLETEGLVTILPYKGATVTKVTIKEIREIYQVRIALQSHATRLAIANLQEEDIEKLDELVVEMHDTDLANNPERSLLINRKFYEYFYSLAKQDRLFDLIMQYLDLARRYRQQHFYEGGQTVIASRYHEKLMDYLHKRDTEKAVDMVRTELQRVADELSDSFQ